MIIAARDGTPSGLPLAMPRQRGRLAECAKAALAQKR